MSVIVQYLEVFKDIIWAGPLPFFVLGVGFYLLILLKGLPLRYFFYSLRQSFIRHHEEAEGDISHFQSLMTFLAGAIGTGAVTGVAVGIAVGGLGSLFWMWLTALTGMAVRYAEALLSIRYREIDRRGEMVGGPMEYIGRGLGWKKTAALFAFLAAVACFGVGNLVQANAIADVVTEHFNIGPWTTGVVLALVTAMVLLGGVKSIGRVTGIMVPFMALLYVGGGGIIILMNIMKLPGVMKEIFTAAFTGSGAVGGFLGSSIIVAVQLGVSRSIFSSEAGLGISAIAAAAAKTDYPARQAMIAMTGVFWATIVVCTVTGLVIGVTGVMGMTDAMGNPLEGTNIALYAFKKGFPGGGWVVTIGLILFAYSTIIAWAYYGEKCLEYLFGEKSVWWYRLLFVVVLIPGAALDLKLVWICADISTGIIVVPNMIALLALSKVILQETKRFTPVAAVEIEKD